jgi:hypothetical protein
MNRGACFSLAGAFVLLALSGCGGGFFQGERAAWRHDAEVACLKTGAVKLGVNAVQIEPIEGPGICGADFPLKVSALGEEAPMSFAEDMRPPAPIPNAGSRMPDWPPHQQRYVPPARIEVAPGQHETLRWNTGPPAVNAPQTSAPAGQPMSLDPPSPTVQAPEPAGRAAPAMAPPMEVRRRTRPDDIPPDAMIPEGGSAAVPERRQHAYNAPVYEPPPAPRREAPRLGPARAPFNTAAIPTAELTPRATLACPMVSALDRWVSEGVQPAALHWFGSPVVKIKQISSYSCRAMVGAGTNHISEHAFGNALDIAAFTLADGRTVTVQKGWHGTAEEQAFLHDVQLYACETFNTVLAPGYNAAHYNHIHVDLMRRSSGRRPCRPDAVRGEVIAARLRSHYADKRRGPAYTGSIGGMVSAARREAIAGEDGYVEDDEADVPLPSRRPRKNAARSERSETVTY